MDLDKLINIPFIQCLVLINYKENAFEYCKRTKSQFPLKPIKRFPLSEKELDQTLKSFF